MASKDLDQLLADSKAALKQGHKAAAKEMLKQALQIDSRSEAAWFYMSAAVERRDQAVKCLENVLNINPENAAAQRALAKLGASQPSSPPEREPEPESPTPPEPTEDSWRQALFQDQPDPEPPPGQQTQSTTSEDDWRQSLYDTPAATADDSYRDEVDRASEPRSILDLFDAWAAAFIFRIRGAFEEEVKAARFTNALISLVFAGFLSAFVTYLFISLVLIPMGGIEGLFEEAMRQSSTTLSAEELSEVTRIFQGLGIGMVIIAFAGIVIGRLIYAALLQVVAMALNGEGSMGEMISAMSIVSVPPAALQFIPALFMLFSTMSGSAGSGLINLLGLFSGIFNLYRLALDVTAVSAAHRNFGIGKSLLTIVVFNLVWVVLGCCFGVAAVALAGAGASS